LGEQDDESLEVFIECFTSLGYEVCDDENFEEGFEKVAINPEKKQLEIYHQGQEKEVLDDSLTFSVEGILPEFILDLALI
jgi:hypothetical protein